MSALCSGERVRSAEAGGDTLALWQDIAAFGYMDALIAEADGGAGLTLGQAFTLWFVAGRVALPVVFSETVMSRAVLASAHTPFEAYGIAMTAGTRRRDGCIAASADIPGVRSAGAVLVECDDEWLFLPLEAASIEPGFYRPLISGRPVWRDDACALARFPCAKGAATSMTRAIHAAEMAGAMSAVLDMSVTYAQDRQQFGKPIAQFQAIQQELSVMAEQTAAAHVAAELGCTGLHFAPQPYLASVAKLRASESATPVCSIAHAIHGAIGVTDEHRLGLYTSRLHEWRSIGGGERGCAIDLGDALLSESESLCDFVRTRLNSVTTSADDAHISSQSSISGSPNEQRV